MGQAEITHSPSGNGTRRGLELGVPYRSLSHNFWRHCCHIKVYSGNLIPELHTAVIGVVRPLLGSRGSGQ